MFSLLWAHRGGDANMRSAWICTRNDVLGNLAVLLAALGVWHRHRMAGRNCSCHDGDTSSARGGYRGAALTSRVAPKSGHRLSPDLGYTVFKVRWRGRLRMSWQFMSDLACTERPTELSLTPKTRWLLR